MRHYKQVKIIIRVSLDLNIIIDLYYLIFIKCEFQKALLTAYENKTFNSIQTRVEDQGFKKVSATNDNLGNQYRRFTSGSVELTLVNKTADWPEIYFQH